MAVNTVIYSKYYGKRLREYYCNSMTLAHQTHWHWHWFVFPSALAGCLATLESSTLQINRTKCFTMTVCATPSSLLHVDKRSCHRFAGGAALLPRKAVQGSKQEVGTSSREREVRERSQKWAGTVSRASSVLRCTVTFWNKRIAAVQRLSGKNWTVKVEINRKNDKDWLNLTTIIQAGLLLNKNLIKAEMYRRQHLWLHKSVLLYNLLRFSLLSEALTEIKLDDRRWAVIYFDKSPVTFH